MPGAVYSATRPKPPLPPSLEDPRMPKLFNHPPESPLARPLPRKSLAPVQVIMERVEHHSCAGCIFNKHDCSILPEELDCAPGGDGSYVFKLAYIKS